MPVRWGTCCRLFLEVLFPMSRIPKILTPQFALLRANVQTGKHRPANSAFRGFLLLAVVIDGRLGLPVNR
jgi:hypothetical protein